MVAKDKNKAVETAIYTHADGRTEVVEVLKKYSEADGGGISIYVPSLQRERQVGACTTHN